MRYLLFLARNNLDSCEHALLSLSSQLGHDSGIHLAPIFRAAEALRQLAYLYGLPALDADAARQSHVSTCVWSFSSINSEVCGLSSFTAC